MNQNLDNMSEKELLAELVEQGRRAEKTERIKICVLSALLLAVIVLALIYVPKILAPIRQIGQSISQIESSFGEMERVLSNFDEDTILKFKDTMDSLSETSQQVRVFMDKLKESGIDKLQSTIEGLSNSLSSFLKFFNR